MTLRPEWLQGGLWGWSSRESEARTIIRVECSDRRERTYQHVITLEWGDYDGDPLYGRRDAEQLADYVCAQLNR